MKRRGLFSLLLAPLLAPFVKAPGPELWGLTTFDVLEQALTEKTYLEAGQALKRACLYDRPPTKREQDAALFYLCGRQW